MAYDILPHFPGHRAYVEPYGGGGSILLRKERSYAEVYNDLDGEVVNLFRVVRDRGAELVALLEMTPFDRDEYKGSFERSEDPVEQVRRTVIRSHMGFGSNALSHAVKSGFRANSNRSGTTPARDWANLPENVRLVVERLRGVVIENKDALDVMRQHDAPETLHYCDPPYVHETRSTKMHGHHGYNHEMDDDQHRAFGAAVRELRGMVVVSGYGCDLYDKEIFPDWDRIAFAALSDKARDRVEVLWLNKSAAAQSGQARLIA